MSNLSFLPASFDDVDLFSQWEKDLGWDIESTQLSPGSMRVDFDHCVTPEFLLGNFRCSGTMRNHVAVPEGVVVLMFCRKKLPFNWCGREVTPSQLGICRSNREHWVVIPAGWDCYEFMLSEDFIRRTEIFPPEFFAKTTRLEDAYLPSVEHETTRFVRQLNALVKGLSHGDLPMDVTGGAIDGPSTQTRRAVSEGELRECVISGLLRVTEAGLMGRGSAPRMTRRADLIPKAKELVEAHLEADFTADDLAQALGVSYRVLNYAFQDALGVSPYQYVLTDKLHAARRKLKTSDISIIDACMTYGFYNPSRFSRQYKRLFGELPSDTRKSAR